MVNVTDDKTEEASLIFAVFELNSFEVFLNWHSEISSFFKKNSITNYLVPLGGEYE